MLRTTVASLAFFCLLQSAPYELVIRGGRVIDPETALDGVRDVGIANGRIVRIAETPLEGQTALDAQGLVVAPGFIDLHSHGQDAENDRLKALDGVTTALELEIGVLDVDRFLREQRGQRRVHYGVTVSHAAARAAAFGAPLAPGVLVPPVGEVTDRAATAGEVDKMKAQLQRGVEAGALGMGMGLTYTPGATRLEVIEMFRLAAANRVPVFVHVRSAGRVEPGSSIEAVSEVIGAAAVTGASLHIVHINSSGLRDATECLRLVAGARARGLDVTTEGYPYGAGQTAINSALFKPGWRERLGIDYDDLMMSDTGERLTKDSFERLHAAPEPRYVIIFMNPDEVVDAVMTHPLVAVASDGGLRDGRGHPRSAGTFARVLKRYVRERGDLTIVDALRKMTLMPARRLERSTTAARRKGRLQEGADADIVVFDLDRVADQATYERPGEPSVGIKHVIVGGTPIVRDGVIVEDVFPGAALVHDDEQAGVSGSR